MRQTFSAEVALSCGATLGEGPHWDSTRQALWWVDIEGESLHRWNYDNGRQQTFHVGQRIGAVICRDDGKLLLALHEGLAVCDDDASNLQVLHSPEAGLPNNRFNDAKCDPTGRLWAGSMNFVNESACSGALYSLDAQNGLRQHLSDVGVSNGLAWSRDGRRMYYIDSVRGTVDCFDFDAQRGDLSNRRVVFQVPDALGGADGMTIDDEGMLWVAFWGGWQCGRIDPDKGELIGKVELPTAHVTSCCFGGPRLDQLFITTAKHGLDAESRARQPHAGDLFVVEPGVAGAATVAYRCSESPA